MDFDVDLPDLTCPDLFLISVERVTYRKPSSSVNLFGATLSSLRKNKKKTEISLCFQYNCSNHDSIGHPGHVYVTKMAIRKHSNTFTLN